jgi:hypothetical protein
VRSLTVAENQPDHHLEVLVDGAGHVLRAFAFVQQVHSLAQKGVATDVEEGTHRA